MATETQILKGRKAVDAYREAHRLLHQKPYYREVHNDHTPLLERMIDALKEQGFNSIDEFFDASEELNLKAMGFKNKADFEAKATEIEIDNLDGMWQ